MTSTTRIVQVCDVTTQTQLHDTLAFRTDRQFASPSPRSLASLREAVERWTNLPIDQLVSYWKFFVPSYDQPVGYIRDEFVKEATWHRGIFEKDENAREIRLRLGIKAHGASLVEACNEALVEFCQQNREARFFEGGLADWLETKAEMESKKRRGECTTKSLDYHPILSSCADLQGLKLPSPIRGILGIVTAGVHMTAYQVEENGKEVNRIWVSKRSSTKKAFRDCYDQTVAGGMEPQDARRPWEVFRREAWEEAGLYVGPSTMHREVKDRFLNRVGVVEEDIRKIYFCTLKDDKAGPKEVGHIEPGIRFCFDLRLDLGVKLTPNERGIDRFYGLSVQEVVESLKDGNWKPNSGLVMLDFLLRKGLVEDEEDRVAIQDLTRKHFPPQLPVFPTS